MKAKYSEATLSLDFNRISEKNNIPIPEKPAREEILSFDEAFEQAIKYFSGDELAAKVWVSKYALKDAEGKIYEGSPDEMHRRMAKEIHRIEKSYPGTLSEQEIFNLLKDFRYIIPQGGAMAGLGNNKQIVSLSNCFVIGGRGDQDSYGAVMKRDEEQVQLMKRRGGVGHDLSGIRPKGSPVKNSAVTSTGVVPFMDRYSNTTREVAQDGRRGALMLSLSVNHPDISDFINAKADTSKVTGANISVRISDEFMQAVKEDKNYTVSFPLGSGKPQYKAEKDAKAVWNNMVHNAWKHAEPGILFWDTIIRESIPDCYKSLGFETVSTNPCGEIPLCPYDSCRLLALNLFSYVRKPFEEASYFDFDLFENHVELAHRMMDDIVDLEIEKIDRIIEKIISDPQDEDTKRTELNLWKKIRVKCVKGRRMGIGVTAEGDMLAALGLTYGEKNAIGLAVEVHKRLAITAYRSSVKLARERGAFPIFDFEKEKDNPFINRIFESSEGLRDDMQKYGRRNIAMLTIAPTGTTSLMTRTTSGIEPLFSVYYKRRRKINHQDENENVDFSDQLGDQWEEYNVVHPQFKFWLSKMGIQAGKIEELSDEEMTELIRKSPYNRAVSNDIDWISKVEMQGAIQKWVDHSISVTVNVPKETTEEMINEIFFKAWESGCKGVTIYRDGSRDGVLVTNSSSKELESELKESRPPRRPQSLPARIVRFQNHNEKWIAAVGMLNDRPYEIFTGCAEDSFLIPNYVENGWVIKNKLGKSGSRYDFQFEDRDGFKVTYEGLSRSFNKEYWNLAKMISGLLRHGMPVRSVVDVVSNLYLDDKSLSTWKHGVIRALSKFIPNGTSAKNNECTECGQDSLEFQEGCLTCRNCGYTKCS